MISAAAPKQRLRLLRRLHRIAGNLLHVARKEQAQSKLALTFEYLRLELQEILHVVLRRPSPHRLKIFGATLEASDRVTLRQMFEEIFLFKSYHFEARRPDPLILDCGSNVGVSVLFFKLLHPEARVVAFEPDPETFAFLERNVAGNLLRDVELHNSAVGASEGFVTFYHDPQVPGALTMSTHRGRSVEAEVRVRSERLSKRIAEPVDFLKLDVEGAELEVIEELISADRLRAIEQMVIEYHHHIDPKEDHFSRFLALLEQNGFGYQLAATIRQRPHPRRHFQDILVYAYRK